MIFFAKSETYHRLFSEFFRFCVVGLACTAVHYGLYLGLIHVISLNDNWWTNVAYSIGYLAGFLCNFILSSLFTFREKVSLKRGIGFALTNVVNFGLHIICLNCFLLLGLSKKWAPIPTYCLVVPINFVLVRFVFRKL